ncbi:MAG: RNA polymerase sigma factor [Calditrichia bacterium]
MPLKQAIHTYTNADRKNKSNRDTMFVDLRVLFDQHYPTVYHIAYQMTQSVQEAEDIAQDVFLKLHKKLAFFRNEAAITTWVYRITMNKTLDHLRWKKLRRLKEIPGNTFDYFTSEKRTIDAPLNNILQQTLNQVKPTYRAVIILRDIEEFSYSEISQILEISMGTVASRLSRGYKQMKKILIKRNIDETDLRGER